MCLKDYYFVVSQFLIWQFWICGHCYSDVLYISVQLLLHLPRTLPFLY